MKNDEDTRWEELANAIVYQAVIEYRVALKHIQKNARDHEAIGRKRELEIFFKSQWFTELTSIDPYRLMDKLKEECL